VGEFLLVVKVLSHFGGNFVFVDSGRRQIRVRQESLGRIRDPAFNDQAGDARLTLDQFDGVQGSDRTTKGDDLFRGDPGGGNHSLAVAKHRDQLGLPRRFTVLAVFDEQ